VAPGIAYVSTEQSLHVALPDTVLYVPAAHAAHAPPSGPVYPALHVQALIAALCPRVFVFTGHCTHAVAPGTSTYLPSAHVVHTVAPVAEIFPAIHDRHSRSSALLLYLPAAQRVQVVAPTSE
jgi:hypothetical protein